jgi:hypothetical protein
MNTPWGESQTVRDLGQGVLMVTTAGHGGIYVPSTLVLHRIPKIERAYAAQWSGSECWYEEDCAAAIPMMRLPEFFPMDEARRVAYFDSVKGYWEGRKTAAA